MKKIIIFIALLLPAISFAQKDSILSSVYSWKEPGHQIKKGLLSTVLFEGQMQDMEWLQMNATALNSPNEIKQQVPDNEEHLLIIKSGTLIIKAKDSSWTLGTGSIALLMPGEKYGLKNIDGVCNYYEMKYRSRKQVDNDRAKTAGGSIIMNWNKIPFVPNNNGGGRRNFFERPTAMSKRFEMHVTTLKEGARSHDPHTHAAEEIILIVNNKTDMQIGDNFYKGAEGSIYYLGSNVLHAIKNDGVGTCTYFAFQFE